MEDSRPPFRPNTVESTINPEAGVLAEHSTSEAQPRPDGAAKGEVTRESAIGRLQKGLGYWRDQLHEFITDEGDKRAIAKLENDLDIDTDPPTKDVTKTDGLARTITPQTQDAVKNLRTGYLRYIEGLRQPDTVQQLSDYIRQNVSYDETFYMPTDIAKNPKKLARKQAELAKDGYRIHDEGYSRDTYKKTVPYIPDRGDRKVLDLLAEVVAQPIAVLDALKNIGYPLNRSDFRSMVDNQFIELAQAVEKHLPLLNRLSADVPNWDVSYDKLQLVSVFTSPMLDGLATNPDLYAQTVELLNAGGRPATILTLPEVVRCSSDPELKMLRTSIQNESTGRIFQAHHGAILGMALATEYGPLMKRLLELGIRPAFWQRDSLLQSYRHYERRDSQDKAVEFARNFVAESEAIEDPETVKFLSEWQTLTGSTVIVQELRELQDLLPQKGEVLAFAQAVRAMHPDLAKHLDVLRLKSYMENTEIFGQLLQPKYANLIHSMVESGLIHTDKEVLHEVVETAYGTPVWLRRFSNEATRAALEDPARVSAIKQVCDRYDISLDSYNGDSIIMRSYPGIGAVLSRLEELGVNESRLQYGLNMAEQYTSPDTQAALLDARIPTLVEHLSVVNEMIEGMYNDAILSVTQIVRDRPDLADKLADPVQHANAIAGIEAIYANNLLLHTVSKAELYQLNDQDIAAIPAYAAEVGANAQVDITQLLAYSREQPAIQLGRERLASLHASKATDFVFLAAVGNQEEWNKLSEVALVLGGKISDSVLSNPAAVEALYQHVAEFSRIGDWSNTYLGNVTGDDILALVPYLAYEQPLIGLARRFRQNFDINTLRATPPSLLERVNQSDPIVQEALGHLDEHTYLATQIQLLSGIIENLTNSPKVCAFYEEVCGPKWQLNDVNQLNFNSENIEGCRQVLSYIDRAQSDQITPGKLTMLSTVDNPVGLKSLELLTTSLGRRCTMQEVFTVSRFCNSPDGEATLSVITKAHTEFNLPLADLFARPHLADYITTPEATSAMSLAREYGVNADNGQVLQNAEAWYEAGRNLGAAKVLFELWNYIEGPSLNAAAHLTVLRYRPEVIDYIKTKHSPAAPFKSYQAIKYTEVFEHRDTASILQQDYGIAFQTIVENAGLLGDAVQLLSLPEARSVLEWAASEGLPLPLTLESAKNWSLVIQNNQIENMKVIKSELGISISTQIESPAFIGFLHRLETDPEYSAEPSEARTDQLHGAELFNYIIANNRYDLCDRWALGSGEVCKNFVQDYGVQNQGATLLTLIAASEYTGQPAKEYMADIAKAVAGYDALLKETISNNVPAGLRTSLGMEYEIMYSASDGYKAEYPGRDFKTDIMQISKFAKVGQGRDALHEIATLPTDNPRVMLLQMKLLQDLGFIDFNFTSDTFKNNAHGYHLTVGGETGVGSSSESRFLQNALTVAGWNGISGGEQLRGTGSVVQARSSSLRERYGETSIPVFGTNALSVELRAMSVDQWESFERSVMTTYHAGVAIQAAETYLIKTNQAEFFSQLPEPFPTSSQALMEYLQSADKFRRIPTDERVQTILYNWIKLQADMLRDTADHNEHFLEREQFGYEDERGNWVDAGEFGGDYNAARFASVATGTDKALSLEDYALMTKIEPGTLFGETDAALANKLSRIANLFLKESKATRGDQTNSMAVLDTTKIGRVIEEAPVHAARQSVFERKGKTRQGYYAYQGGSERMILHAAQRSLLEFNTAMAELLARKSEAVETAQVDALTAVAA